MGKEEESRVDDNRNINKNIAPPRVWGGGGGSLKWVLGIICPPNT
jgi:hypothetical protein